MSLWTVVITRTLHTSFSGPEETKEEAEKRGWEDAIEKGIIQQHEIDDGQGKVEATKGIALSWREK